MILYAECHTERGWNSDVFFLHIHNTVIKMRLFVNRNCLLMSGNPGYVKMEGDF